MEDLSDIHICRQISAYRGFDGVATQAKVVLLLELCSANTV